MEDVVSSPDSYRRQNVRKAVIYFIILISLQAVALYAIYKYGLKEMMLYAFLLGVFVATILPVLLAILLFGRGGRQE